MSKAKFKQRHTHTHTHTYTYTYVYTQRYIYLPNINNPELFTEIMKNIELENNDKIKEILDTTKIIKSQRQT